MKTSFVISGVLGFFIWPAVIVSGIMLSDNPNATPKDQMLAETAFYTSLLPPLTWFACIAFAIFEVRSRNRHHLLRAYAVAPYAVAGVHALALVALFSFTT